MASKKHDELVRPVKPVAAEQAATIPTGVTPPALQPELQEVTKVTVSHFPPQSRLLLVQMARKLPEAKPVESQISGLLASMVDYPVKREAGAQHLTAILTTDEVFKQHPNLMRWDMRVYTAIAQIWNDTRAPFTVDQVYHYATGDRTVRVTASKRKKVTDSIEKMMNMSISVNVAPEWNLYHRKGKKAEMYLRENMLQISQITVEANGKRTDGYILARQPVIDRYASDVNQIGMLDNELVKPFSGSPEDSLIAYYLGRRLIGMTNANNKLVSSKIAYDAVYKEADAADATKQKKAKIRQKAKDVLTYWVSLKIISSYHEYKEGRVLKGVELVFPRGAISKPKGKKKASK